MAARMTRAIILANGPLPGINRARTCLASGGLVVCADGGAGHARRLRIRPDCIIGDIDSVSARTRAFFRDVPLLRIADQESTDLEKAVSYCIARRRPSVTILGGLGGRIDHTAGNLGIFRKFGRLIDITMVDSHGELTLIRTRAALRANIGETLSLIPLDRCTGVSTSGLRYPLRNESLEIGVREGTSNEAVARAVSIRVRKGTLLLYRIAS